MTFRTLRNAITASQAVMATNKQYQVLPDYYYKDVENYLVFWLCLVQFTRSSRTLPDDLTMCMSRIVHEGRVRCFFVPHWHQLTSSDDGRSLRNMLQCDGSGRPKRRSRNIDLLRYIDICLQSQYADYARYVENWCHQQAMCVGEEEF